MAVSSFPMARQVAAEIQNPEDETILASQRFVAARLRRKPTDEEDAALQHAEVSILLNSERLFGRRLQGDIAVPLAHVFMTSDSPNAA